MKKKVLKLNGEFYAEMMTCHKQGVSEKRKDGKSYSSKIWPFPKHFINELLQPTA